MRRSLSLLLTAAAGSFAVGCSSGHSSAAPQGSASSYGSPQPATRTASSYGSSAPAAPSPAAYSAPAHAYAPTAGGPIPYDARDISFDQALAAGRAAGKPVAFYIFSPTCPHCSHLESASLTDGSVQTEMHAFYNVRIDSHMPVGAPIVRQYATSGVPTVAIVDTSGALRTRIIGYEPAASIASKLRAAH